MADKTSAADAVSSKALPMAMALLKIGAQVAKSGIGQSTCVAIWAITAMSFCQTSTFMVAGKYFLATIMGMRKRIKPVPSTGLLPIN